MPGRLAARDIRLKRAYRPAAAGDGARILVDRLWPRGLKKSDAAIDRWLKDIAPSTALRAIARKGPVTLIFAARDELRNDAVVLRYTLLGR
jgi:uncharacterized protein YeaO (DUF488 family)